jgi:hypothetical protein
MARVISGSDDPANEGYSMQLAESARSLCYAPSSVPSAAGNLMDYGSDLPWICDGGFAEGQATWLNVSLTVLQQSPECSLRVTLAPQIPMQW